MAVRRALSSSSAIAGTGRIQNVEPPITAALKVWLRKVGSVMSARRLRETADRERRAGIGSSRKMRMRSSVGRAVKGLADPESVNAMNVGPGEAVGEGQLKVSELYRARINEKRTYMSGRTDSQHWKSRNMAGKRSVPLNSALIAREVCLEPLRAPKKRAWFA